MSETGNPAYTRIRLAQSSDLELKSQHRLSGSLILEMPQASPSDTATGSLPLYFAHMVWVKFAHPIHLLTILTMYACHHNSFWGSRCDSNHAPTISLKPRTLSQFISPYDTSLIKAHFIANYSVTTKKMSKILDFSGVMFYNKQLNAST